MLHAQINLIANSCEGRRGCNADFFRVWVSSKNNPPQRNVTRPLKLWETAQPILKQNKSNVVPAFTVYSSD